MRLILLASSVALSTGAAPPVAVHDSILTAYAETAQKRQALDDAGDALACRERIEQVRDTIGQPRLDRTPVESNEGMMIAAVDKRIDGCPVVQMHGNVNDVRPVPSPTVGPVRLQPAH